MFAIKVMKKLLDMDTRVAEDAKKALNLKQHNCHDTLLYYPD